MIALTPLEVLELRRQALLSGDTAAFVGLFAQDGAIELPFAGPGLPGRIAGQRAVEQFSQIVSSAVHIDELETTALYQTDDPEVVIVEVAAKGRIGTDGKAIAARSIQVFRIRDGRIVLFRDYADPSVLADHLGT